MAVDTIDLSKHFLPDKPLIAESASEPEAVSMLEQYSELYEQNTDMIGWIRIDGTEINYPVMFTGNDFYLEHDFSKERS